MPAAKHFNQTGRGFPDVSTIGESFWIFCQVRGRGMGRVSGIGVVRATASGRRALPTRLLLPQGLDEPVDGTSCAAPTFTGVVSLLNDARRGAGKAPLGYLNQVRPDPSCCAQRGVAPPHCVVSSPRGAPRRSSTRTPRCSLTSGRAPTRAAARWASLQAPAGTPVSPPDAPRCTAGGAAPYPSFPAVLPSDRHGLAQLPGPSQAGAEPALGVNRSGPGLLP